MKLSIQEISILASMGGALLGAVGYAVAMIWIYQRGQLSEADVGAGVLLLMVACALARHLFKWLFYKAFSIQKTLIAPVALDERDKLIELKGMQASYAAFAVGFVMAMGALWLGSPSTLVISLVAFSLIAGEVVSGWVRLYQYRSGY